MRSIIKKLLSRLLIMVAATLWTANAFAASGTPISLCGTVITASGNYFLSKNLMCPGQTAVMIAANKVDLDLNGFGLSGAGEQGIGISTSSSDISQTGDLSQCVGVTSLHIHGGTVALYGNPNETISGTGILLCSPNQPGTISVAMSVQLDHMVLQFNETGLALVSSGKNKIANNYVANNAVGVDLANGCANNNISGNLLDGNATGIAILGSTNTVTGNVAMNNTLRGILIGQAAVNTQTTSNYTSHNLIGIEAQEFAAGNVFNGNTSFANTNFDLADDNGNCTTNSWKGDFFSTSSPACIQ